MTVVIVFGLAGNASWLTYLISIGILLLTAICINVYAVRWSTPGSLYAYVTVGGGRYAGFTTGWCLLLAYLLGTSACSIQFAVFANEILKEFGGAQLPLLVGTVACAVFSCMIARSNIKLSAEVMLWLELLSLSAITLLCVIAQIHNGFKFDVSQLRLEGISGTGACTGLVMAIFGFVGFESAATLGAEADDPKNKIPQALMTSVLGCGVFFVFTTFIIVSTFKGIKGVQLASCATPLLVMSDYLGVTWLGKFTNFGAAVSFFACTLAATNAAGRIMLTMAHDGLFPRSLATVCAVRRTPAKAILVAVIIGILPAVALVSFGLPTLDIVGWLGTLATYGYLVAYFLISVTSCFYLKGLGQLRKPMILVATLSALCTMAAFVGTFYPVPQGVYKWLPYLCCTYVLIGLFFCYFRSKNLAEPVSAALIEQ